MARYEREFGVAQRPLVRRILERDSSPSLPMVLLVFAIHSIDGKDGSVVSLELSDGWYCINAQIDDCLKRAIDKGKIVVGRKLAITGAKVCLISLDYADLLSYNQTARKPMFLKLISHVGLSSPVTLHLWPGGMPD